MVLTHDGCVTSHGAVNQYELLREIGSGSYGRVVLAYSHEAGRYYACKVISKSRLRRKFRWSASNGGSPVRSIAEPASGVSVESVSGPQWMENVKREVAILKKLSNHPNINQLVEVLDDARDDSLYMVFELCEYGAVMKIQLGEPVRPFTEELARKYFRDILLGLEFLHYKKIIHRDIKPENILLRHDGTVQIADFGISHMFREEEEDAQIQDRNASPAFSPPEVFSSSKDQNLAGKAIDIWSLGVTLFCFVHGHAPFEDANPVELARKIEMEPLIISECLSVPLSDLLSRMLDKNPKTRIKLPNIRVHEWITEGGSHQLITTEENCTVWGEDVTSEEVELALSPAVSLITKVCTDSVCTILLRAKILFI
ncbi:kinase-like protein [Gonapodya prolifera JEL478]|uniref:Kinase-like protein n=1 Tax=Gonapodya prolifera (strain JEL478) TaxID=1344416 RepID=A0A139ATV7_GONPJ|nr:kinase-like protein [Gonapodya prolifera JEL478]|eukprot:KXS19935.1 kinase-like protein [Gonapodya prolifera JEL478]